MVINLWISQTRKTEAISMPELEEATVRHDPSAAIDERGCAKLVDPVLREAAASIDTEDRVLLKMLILNGVPQHRLAEISNARLEAPTELTGQHGIFE